MEESLQELIRNGESATVEFKKTITSLPKIAKAIVSFANSQGGTILIGVQDDKSIIGVNVEEEKFMIHQAANKYCEPAVHVHFEEVETEEGKSILLVQVPASRQKPHKMWDGAQEWKTYIRSGNQSLIASKLVEDVLAAETQLNQKKNPGFTKNQQSLLSYLNKKNRITVKELAKKINVSKRKAHRILTDMTLQGHLYVHDLEKTSYYSLA